MKTVTLIGADASGKDTQMAMLKEHFEKAGKKVQVITIWDSLVEFASIPDKKILKQTIETFLLSFEPEARSFFLMSCLKNSESKIRDDVDYVFLNGFFQKYWASEAAYGVPRELWKTNSERFLKSDVTLYLQTSLEQCLKRKQDWSNYEQGKGRFFSQTLQSREDFQRKLHEELDLIVSGTPEAKIVSGNQAPHRVFKDIIQLI